MRADRDLPNFDEIDAAVREVLSDYAWERGFIRSWEAEPAVGYDFISGRGWWVWRPGHDGYVHEAEHEGKFYLWIAEEEWEDAIVIGRTLRDRTGFEVKVHGKPYKQWVQTSPARPGVMGYGLYGSGQVKAFHPLARTFYEDGTES